MNITTFLYVETALPAGGNVLTNAVAAWVNSRPIVICKLSATFLHRTNGGLLKAFGYVDCALEFDTGSNSRVHKELPDLQESDLDPLVTYNNRVACAGENSQVLYWESPLGVMVPMSVAVALVLRYYPPAPLVVNDQVESTIDIHWKLK